jgi:hypothetical protein
MKKYTELDKQIIDRYQINQYESRWHTIIN